jgi:CoA:oxalate CoA-transferase
MTLPLDGFLVLDFSQFLAGPSAALRLADLGASVIKIERPGGGELGRQLYISDCQLDGDSTLFHTINRNKRSYAADLKSPKDIASIRRLIAKADVLIENFRPGVMDRLGLGYDAVKQLRPELVYSTVTGYGSNGPWKDKPGQDLLVQSISGLTWLSGHRDSPPTAMGLAVVDMFAGAHLTQGILASLVGRARTGRGGRVEVSLLESALDMQFEVFTTYLNDGQRQPDRGSIHSAHAYLSAPYGIYQTSDGYLALAMGPIPELAATIGAAGLDKFVDRSSWFENREQIQAALAERLKSRSTADWLGILEAKDIWCADVMNWQQLMQHGGFQAIDMVQTVKTSLGTELRTTRCPIRINQTVHKSSRGAPRVGEHTDAIQREFRLGTLGNKRVGVIGLGTMGGPVARNLLAADIGVSVWNRTATKSRSFESLGATVGESPARIAEECDIVLLFLADDESVRDVVAGADGLVHSCSAKTIVNCSTVAPETNVEMADLLRSRDGTLIDAPVLGSRPQAEAGKLFFLVGGTKEAVEKCAPVFDILGRGYIHLGPVGSGACAKLANNLMGLTNLAGLMEALKLVESYGLAAESFLKVVASGGARSAMSDAKSAKLLAEDWRADFSLLLAAKDLKLAGELARSVGAECPILNVVEQVYAQSADAFGGDDVCTLRRWYSK